MFSGGLDNASLTLFTSIMGELQTSTKVYFGLPKFYHTGLLMRSALPLRRGWGVRLRRSRTMPSIEYFSLDLCCPFLRYPHTHFFDFLREALWAFFYGKWGNVPKDILSLYTITYELTSLADPKMSLLKTHTHLTLVPMQIKIFFCQVIVGAHRYIWIKN